MDAPRLVRWTLPVTGENGWNRHDLALAMDAAAAYSRPLWTRLSAAYHAWEEDGTHVLLTREELRQLTGALVMASGAYTGGDSDHAAELVGTLL